MLTPLTKKLSPRSKINAQIGVHFRPSGKMPDHREKNIGDDCLWITTTENQAIHIRWHHARSVEKRARKSNDLADSHIFPDSKQTVQMISILRNIKHSLSATWSGVDVKWKEILEGQNYTFSHPAGTSGEKCNCSASIWDSNMRPYNSSVLWSSSETTKAVAVNLKWWPKMMMIMPSEWRIYSRNVRHLLWAWSRQRPWYFDLGIRKAPH